MAIAIERREVDHDGTDQRKPRTVPKLLTIEVLDRFTEVMDRFSQRSIDCFFGEELHRLIPQIESEEPARRQTLRIQ